MARFVEQPTGLFQSLRNLRAGHLRPLEPGQPLPVTTLFLGELRGELLTFRGSMVATDFCR